MNKFLLLKNKYSKAFDATQNLKGFSKCPNNYLLTDQGPIKLKSHSLEVMD